MGLPPHVDCRCLAPGFRSANRARRADAAPSTKVVFCRQPALPTRAASRSCQLLVPGTAVGRVRWRTAGAWHRGSGVPVGELLVPGTGGSGLRVPRRGLAGRLVGLPARVRVRGVVRLAAAAVRDVGVQLGRRQVGVAEHLLDAAQVGSAFQQVRRERVPQQVRMDARGVEARLGGEAPQDQERAGARQRAALRVQEELGPVARVEVRAAAGEVAPERLDGRASERDDALLVALAGDADEAVVEVDPRLVEPDRLGDAEARRRRAARPAPGRAACAAWCRSRPRSAARPRRPTACAAGCAPGAAGSSAAAGLSPRLPSSCSWR